MALRRPVYLILIQVFALLVVVVDIDDTEDVYKRQTVRRTVP